MRSETSVANKRAALHGVPQGLQSARLLSLYGFCFSRHIDIGVPLSGGGDRSRGSELSTRQIATKTCFEQTIRGAEREPL